MIEVLDTHVVERLQRIKFSGMPLKVYPPKEPLRDLAEAIYPHIAVVREGPFPSKRRRANIDVFAESLEQVTINPPQWLGGGQRTGPERYTVKAGPVSVEVKYRLDLRASIKGFVNAMIARILGPKLLPDGYWPELNDQAPLFRLEDMQDLDELVKPKFWTALKYKVEDLWIVEPTGYDVHSITAPEMELEA